MILLGGCHEARRLMWDYASDRLPEGALEWVEQHLTGCDRCRRELAGVRRAQMLLAACREAPVPPPSSNWYTLQARAFELAGSALSADRPSGIGRHVATGSAFAAVTALAILVAFAAREGIGSRAHARSHAGPAVAKASSAAARLADKELTVSKVAALSHGARTAPSATGYAAPLQQVADTVHGTTGIRVTARSAAHGPASPAWRRLDHSAPRLTLARAPGRRAFSAPSHRLNLRRQLSVIAEAPASGARFRRRPLSGVLQGAEGTAIEPISTDTVTAAYVMPVLRPDGSDDNSTY